MVSQFQRDAPQQLHRVGAFGRAAYVVSQHEVLRIPLAMVLDPVGQQSRLADAGLAQDYQRRTIASRVRVQAIEVVLPRTIDARAAAGESRMAGGFTLAFLLFGKETVEGVRKIIDQPLMQLLNVVIRLTHLANARLVRLT